MKTIIAAFAVIFALAVYAYLPPVEERCGVKVEIGLFPQKIERTGKNSFDWPLGVTEVQAGAPRPFTVSLENRTGNAVVGELEVWMNDDWDVSGPQGTVALAPGEKKELAYTGTSRPRALNALYPVHARFTPSGAKKDDAPLAVGREEDQAPPLDGAGPEDEHVLRRWWLGRREAAHWTTAEGARRVRLGGAHLGGACGDTWTPPLFAIDPPGPLRILDPGLWTDPDGKVWLFYAQLYGMWDGRAGVWAMHPLDPEDANTGWTPARRLCHGYLKNKPIIMRDGTWLLPCEFMNCKPWGGRIGDVRSVPKEFTFEMPEYRAANVFASKDKGKTVTFLGNAQVPPKDRDCTENMVVERRDGTLWMLVRVKYGIAETFSSDGGKTWSELRPSAILNPNSRFFIGRLKSGAMLLVKNGPVGKKMGRSHITAFVSDDDGATWLGGLVLDERNHVSYPDAVEGPDGFIHVVHDRERTKAREILHHRFTEADVRAGRLVTPGSRLKGIVNKAGLHE